MIKILSNRYPAQEFLEAFADDLIEPITDRKVAPNPDCPTCQTAVDERNLARRLEKLVRNCYARDQPYHPPSELAYRTRRKEQLISKVPVAVPELQVVEQAVIVEEMVDVKPTMEAEQIGIIEQEKFDALQKRIKELECQNNTLHENAIALQDTHNQELSSKDAKIDDLTREKNSCEDASASKDEEASKVLRSLKQKCEEIEIQNATLRRNAIDTQKIHNEELAQKDNSIKDLRKEQIRQEERSTKKDEEASREFHASKKKFKELKNDCATLRQEAIDARVTYQKELAKKKSDIEELVRKKACYEEKFASQAEKAFEQAFADLQVLNKKFEVLESRDATLRQKASDAEASYSGLKLLVEDLEQKISELQEDKGRTQHRPGRIGIEEG